MTSTVALDGQRLTPIFYGASSGTVIAKTAAVYHEYRERALTEAMGGEEIRLDGGREIWPDEPDSETTLYRLRFVELGCAWTIQPPADYVRPGDLKVKAV